jgi:hypothetical protein
MIILLNGLQAQASRRRRGSIATTFPRYAQPAKYKDEDPCERLVAEEETSMMNLEKG